MEMPCLVCVYCAILLSSALCSIKNMSHSELAEIKTIGSCQSANQIEILRLVTCTPSLRTPSLIILIWKCHL